MGQSLHTHDVTHMQSRGQDVKRTKEYWEKNRNLCRGFVSSMAIISSQTNVQMNNGLIIMCYIVILNLLSGCNCATYIDNYRVNSKLPKWHLPSYYDSCLSVCLPVSARRSFFSFNSHDVKLNLWYFPVNQNQFNHIKSWNKMISKSNEKRFCNSIQFYDKLFSTHVINAILVNTFIILIDLMT